MASLHYLAYLSNDAWARLVHALLHSLWIGTLLAAGLAAALWLIPARRTGLRYGLAVAAMAVLFVAVLVAWVVSDGKLVSRKTASVPAAVMAVQTAGSPTTATSSAAAPVRSPALTPNAPAAAMSNLRIHVNWTAWAAAFWLIGVTGMLARTAAALAGAGRLRRFCRPADPAIEAVAAELRRSLRIARRVGVAVCDAIVVPAAMGIVRPLVLIPAALLSIPPEQLRAVLAHELAHIRRHDYLVNIAQFIFEALLFFNPAAWWVSRQIRQEREACCDGLAQAALGGHVDYAQALADCAIGLAGPPPALQSLAGREGSLLDRILRLTRPDYRPRLRLPWHGLILVMLIATLVLACLKKGTEKAAEALSGFLSTEQVDEMEAIQKQYALPQASTDTESTYELSGHIRTADGDPITARINLVLSEYAGDQTSHIAISADRDNRFRHKTHFGSVTIYASAPGYGLATVGPIRHATKDPVSNVDVVLKRGYEARIRMIDLTGRPLGGVRLTGYYAGVGNQILKLSSDDNGIAVLDGISSAPLDLAAIVPGYQQSEKNKLSLAAGQTVDWTMQPAHPTHVKIVDSATSRPIEGAELHLVTRTAPGRGIGANESEAIALTDANGMITLDTLDDTFMYHYFVESPDHRREKLMNISSGKDVIVALGRPLIVKGRVLGLDKLDRRGRRGDLTINVNQPFNAPGYSTYASRAIPVTDLDGIGEFTIDRIWEGELSLDVGDQYRKLQVHDSIRNLFFDLTRPEPVAAEERQATRTVEIVFGLPAGAPVPRGSLKINYTVIKRGERWIESKTLPIADGRVRTIIPVPNEVEVNPKSIVGYWIKSGYPGEKVPDAPGVFTMKLAAVPAGTIFGKVLEEDGRPASGIMIHVVEVKKSPARPDGSSFSGEIKNSAGGSEDTQNTFSAGYLPLGGTYAIVVHRDKTYVMSDPIELAEKKPMREIVLKLPVGVTVEGCVLMPDGQPVPSFPLYLGVDTRYGYGIGSELTTDAQGRFRFEHMNPKFDGTTELRLRPTRQWQTEKIAFKANGKPVEIRLKPGKVLSGQVVDADTGAPIAGCEMRAYTINPWTDCRAEGPTDSQGRFRFSTLGDGVYTIQASPQHSDGPYQSPNVEATAGQAEPAVIRIKWVKNR